MQYAGTGQISVGCCKLINRTVKCSAAEGYILANLAWQSCLSETAWHKNLIRAEMLIQLKTVNKSVLLPWSIVRYRVILS